MRRTVVAVALAVAVTASTASTAVAAFAHPSSSSPAAHAHASSGKPAKPSKPSRPKKFAVSGSITAVAADTITVSAKDGVVTVTVPAGARVVVNGARKSLADITAGYRVTVVGVRTGTVYTAVRVQARGAKIRHTPEPSPSSSTHPTPEPSESASPEPSHTSADD